jgi:hypothetical protein
MSWFREIGVILRTLIPFEDDPHRPSRNLREAISRLDHETQTIKEEAAQQTNTQVLSQLLDQIK